MTTAAREQAAERARLARDRRRRGVIPLQIEIDATTIPALLRAGYLDPTDLETDAALAVRLGELFADLLARAGLVPEEN